MDTLLELKVREEDVRFFFGCSSIQNIEQI